MLTMAFKKNINVRYNMIYFHSIHKWPKYLKIIPILYILDLPESSVR